MSEEKKEVKTPLQVAEEEKLKAQQSAVNSIQKILDDNGLTIVVEQLVRIVPKK